MSEKSVVSGEIRRISPSMISAFDPDSRFGCLRRGWFKYVLGIKEPTTPEMTRGLHLHAMNEEYLKTGRLLLGTPEQTAWFRAGQNYLDSIRHKALLVEAPVRFEVDGIPVSEMSKCDTVVLESPGIIDWKTTTSIEKYGKTPGQLAKDVQMLIYAKAFHPDAPTVKLTHGQYQVDHPVMFRAASVELSRQELDDNYGQVIIPRVAKMKEVVKATEAKEVQPNRDACRRCPHQGICPPDKENPLMGIFDKMRKAASPPTNSPVPATFGLATTGVASDVAEEIKKAGGVTAYVTGVLPPDAPKSDPALAAKPVEGFSPAPPPRKHQFVDVPPVEKPTAPATPSAIAAQPPPPPTPPPAEVKRGRGRPPGSKNKAKSDGLTLESANEIAKQVGAETAVKLDQVLTANPLIQFETVTVNYGLTLNLGNFNSARIDCSMSAKFSGNPDVAFAQVLEKVKANVEAEINKVQQAAQLNPNPEKK